MQNCKKVTLRLRHCKHGKMSYYAIVSMAKCHIISITIHLIETKKR